MKLKRTHTIKALLVIYVGLSAAVCIALPSHLPDAESSHGTASMSSAPLELPPDIQQRIEEDRSSANDTPQAAAEPETDETLPQVSEETEEAAEADTAESSETEAPPETAQEPETETPSETNQEPETETPQKSTAYVSTEHAGASVNLRAAANSGSEIIATVYDQDEVTVLSASGKWYEVQTGDVTGYIYQDYVVPAGE